MSNVNGRSGRTGSGELERHLQLAETRLRQRELVGNEPVLGSSSGTKFIKQREISSGLG